MADSGILSHHQTLLNQGEFRIQRCTACATHIYFPREVCPHCGAVDLAWLSPSGCGTVYAVTIVRRKLEAGGDYNVSLVDLDEGVRLMSRVTCAAHEVRIGQRVQARVQVTDGIGLLVFDLMDRSLSNEVAI